MKVVMTLKIIVLILTLQKGDEFWVYSREADNKYKFEKKAKLKELNLPNNLNAVFNDLNGDQIYVKNNFFFWKEYGIMKKNLIQNFLFCSDASYNIETPDVNSFKDFVKDVTIWDKVDFNQEPFPKPGPNPFDGRPTLSPLEDNETTEPFPEGSTQTNVDTTTEKGTTEPGDGKDDGFQWKLWHIIVRKFSDATYFCLKSFI